MGNTHKMLVFRFYFTMEESLERSINEKIEFPEAIENTLSLRERTFSSSMTSAFKGWKSCTTRQVCFHPGCFSCSGVNFCLTTKRESRQSERPSSTMPSPLNHLMFFCNAILCSSLRIVYGVVTNGKTGSLRCTIHG